MVMFAKARAKYLPTRIAKTRFNQTGWVGSTKRYGFMIRERGLYNASTFYNAFINDIKQARGLIIIHSPYLSTRQIDQFKEHFRASQSRGVRICVIAQKPMDWDRRDEVVSRTHSMLESSLRMLQQLQIHVSLRPDVHQKLVVVDEDILWSGSMNVLSHFKTKERMERWKSRCLVEEAISVDELDFCEECSRNQSLPLVPNADDSYSEYMQLMGRYIRQRRRQMRFPQSQLAAMAKVGSGLISEIECGKRNVQLDTLHRIAEVLRFQLLPIPWHCVRTVSELHGALGEPMTTSGKLARISPIYDSSYVSFAQRHGEFISQRRQMLSMSQSELAKDAGVRNRLLSELEQGKRTVQSDTLFRIAGALKYRLLPVPCNCAHAVASLVGFGSDASQEKKTPMIAR